MYDPDMARKAREDDEDYYRERAARIDARPCIVCGEDSSCTAAKEVADDSP